MEEVSPGAETASRTSLTTCTVDVEMLDGHVLVSLAGEIDMADADQVGDVLASAAERGKPLVRVGLSELRFADSSAVKALLMGAKAADDRGVAFELVNPRGLVQRLLEVTGLTMALTVVQEPGDGSISH